MSQEVTVVVESETVKGQRDKDSIDMGDLCAVNAMCCCIQSLYLDFKNCWGCSQSGDVLCFGGQGLCCKASAEEDRWCICSKSEVFCAKPKTCIGCQQQCFCLDTRCALPCTDNVPCMFTILGFTCNYNKACTFKACKKLKDIDPEYNHEQEVVIGNAPAYGAPSQVVATR